MSENLTREWINFSDQIPFDKNYLSKSFNIPEEFLSYATDKDESARIEMDDETKSLLIIFDIPFEDQTDVAYYSFWSHEFYRNQRGHHHKCSGQKDGNNSKNSKLVASVKSKT